MHRRGLISLSSASKTLPAAAHGSCRHYAQGASGSSFGLKHSKQAQDDRRNEVRVTDRLMNAAANAEDNWPGWERRHSGSSHQDMLRQLASSGSGSRPGRGKEPRLDELDVIERMHDSVQKKKLPPTAPSPGHAAFISTNEEAALREQPGFSDSLGGEEELLGGEDKFLPGSYVEIRRNGTFSCGVILHETVVNNRIRITVITRSGNTWDIAPSDVFFMISNFVPPALAKKCGDVMLTNDPSELAARVDVLRNLIAFERKSETVRTTMGRASDALYDRLKAADPEQWAECTLGQVADMIKQPVESETLKLVAVHRQLMHRSDRFVVSGLNYRQTQTFLIRPQAHLDVLNDIMHLVRTRSPVLDSFVVKAKVIMSRAREARLQTWHEAPSVGDADTSFTDEERKILRFLRISFYKKRHIQINPYEVAQNQIVQRLVDSDQPIDEDTVHQLLTDLNLLAPWEDLGSLEFQGLSINPGRSDSSLPKTQESIAHRFVEAQKQLASSTSQVLAPISPEDLHVRDPHEAIRHDFGDMPVYVIDDTGAQELDDGISLEECPSEPGKVWVHVHIADPTALIPPTHKFAESARQHGQTLYMTHATLPMLPKSLMDDMSLGARSERGLQERVLTFSTKIDENGDIVDYKVRAGLIRNVHILRYDEDVNTVLNIPLSETSYPFGDSGRPLPVSPSPSAPMKEEDIKNLHRLHSISQSLAEHRRRLPVFISQITEANVSANSALPSPPADQTLPHAYSGFPSLTYALRPASENMRGARMMVAEYMVAACRVASRFCLERRVPALRRTAPQALTPSDDAFEELLRLRNHVGSVDHVTIARLGAVFPPTTYSLDPHEFWALGVPRGEGYLRVTSPLRRFEDLLAHWQIKHALLTEAGGGRATPLLTVPQMLDVMTDLTSRNAVSRIVSTLDRRYWLLAYIRRWRADPRRTDADRALVDFDALEGVVAAGATRDILLGGNAARFYIPKLGVFASLADMPNKGDVAIGTPFKAKLRTIELGYSPRMIVTPA